MTHSTPHQKQSARLTLNLQTECSLSAGSHPRREAMLVDLQQRLARRRRVRACTSAALFAASLACVVGVVGWRFGLVTHDPVVIPISTATAKARTPAPLIERVSREDQAGVLTRFATAEPTFKVAILTDQQLLEALEHAGEPGLIKIRGRVMLRRELAKSSSPAQSEPEAPGPGADVRPLSSQTHG